VLTLTRKADYGLLAMAELARRWPARASARELADVTSVAWPVLTNILHRLRRYGLIVSTMGGKGGYSLARTAESISLADIIEAIEGPPRLTLCCGGHQESGDEPHDCELEPDCRIKRPIRRVHASLRNFLDQVTLARIAFDDDPTPVALRSTGGASESDCDARVGGVSSKGNGARIADGLATGNG
jgi:Rrf2 family protein